LLGDVEREAVDLAVAALTRRTFPEASPSQQINREIGGVESFPPVMTKILV